MSFLTFRSEPIPVTRKTPIWSVWSSAEHTLLGRIHWFAAWRTFVFSPEPETIFDRKCLREIEDKIVVLLESRHVPPGTVE